MKRLLPPALAPLVLAIGATWPGTAAAQDVWGWSIITPSVTGTDQLGLHLRDQLARSRAQQQRGLRSVAPSRRALLQEAPGDVPVDLTALRYTPSKSRRTANLARFIEKTRAVDPAGAKDLQTLFASGDVIDKIGTLIAPYDMRVDNLADAYALWWMTAWQATRGNNDTPDRATSTAVRAQTARALSGLPELVGASESAKQELAESLLVQTALIDGAVEQAKKRDPGRLRDIGAAVAKGADGMGIDLSSMELTDHGFVPADTGSARPAAAPIKQAAAVDRQAGQASPSPIWLATAAAGGVGLGGYLLLRRRGA